MTQTRRVAIRVRDATLADLSTVVDLRIALLRENSDHPIYGRLRRDAEARASDAFAAQLDAMNETMFLAEDGDEAVGILRCVDATGSPLLNPLRYCYVSSVYVRPHARRAGVLRALMDRAIAWCRDRGLDEMRLHNVPDSDAAAAWDALGFDVVEQVRARRFPHH